MNILISGGSGYLGGNLARLLASEGHRVCLPLRSQSSTVKISDLKDSCAIERYSSQLDLKKIILNARPEIFIHMATSYGRSGESDVDIVKANVLFGISLLEITENLGYPVKFINTDTCLEANLNSYALSKSQFVDWGRLLSNSDSNNLTFINVKLQQFYGPSDDKTKLPGHIVHSCLANSKSLELTEGTQLRDFIYVDDVLSAYSILVDNIENFEQFTDVELGTGRSITIREFVESVHSMSESSIKLLFGALPFRKNEPEECVADPAVLISLGWEPKFSLMEGLRQVIEVERSCL